MATEADLMGVGLSWPVATRLGYTPASYSATPGITVQASATNITNKIALLTVATATAASFNLPANPAVGSFHYVTNLFASTATASVFPATGNFLAGVTNTAVTLTTGQSCLFYTVASGTAASVSWYYNKSA